MASLTPGVLLKLLQHASDGNSKVTGEHRSALLQVLEIIPALAAGDDPWQNTGFFLKVSDSMHSAYVSISDEDLDLIFSDKIQLGQFLYVSRLDPGSPVPVIRGIKPIPKRRPYVGNPTDLVSIDCLSIRPNVDFSARRQGLEKVRKSPKNDGGNKTKVKRSSELEDKSRSRRRDSLRGNARVEDLELNRLSLDSMRRGWEKSPGSKNANNRSSPSSHKSKDITGSPDSASILSVKASSSNKSVLKHRSLNCSPPSGESNGLSPKILKVPLKREVKANNGNSPSSLVKIPVRSKLFSEKDISWGTLPSSMHVLGKDTMQHRDAAFVAAVDALQEASAGDCIIRCLSMFSELCAPDLQDSPGHIVEQFLNLYKNIQQATTVVNELLEMKSQEGKICSSSGQIAPPDACENSMTVKAVDAATSWVQAALDTDLSRFSLFVKQDRKEALGDEKIYCIVLENSHSTISKYVNCKSPSPQSKANPRILGSMSDLNTKKASSRKRAVVAGPKKTNTEKGKWSKGSGLNETASLAKQLLLLSRGWFLKYLEDSLSNGFGLKGGEEDDGIAVLFGQIKKVNQWLELAVGDDIEVNERIESLRKKLYGFLLEHLDACVLPSRQGMC